MKFDKFFNKINSNLNSFSNIVEKFNKNIDVINNKLEKEGKEYKILSDVSLNIYREFIIIENAFEIAKIKLETEEKIKHLPPELKVSYIEEKIKFEEIEKSALKESSNIIEEYNEPVININISDIADPDLQFKVKEEIGRLNEKRINIFKESIKKLTSNKKLIPHFSASLKNELNAKEMIFVFLKITGKNLDNFKDF